MRCGETDLVMSGGPYTRIHKQQWADGGADRGSADCRPALGSRREKEEEEEEWFMTAFEAREVNCTQVTTPPGMSRLPLPDIVGGLNRNQHPKVWHQLVFG